jgi:hypothetical protein
MSVDTFIQAFERGEPQAIKTKDILECFEGVITARSADYIDVAFGPQDSSTIYFDVDNEVETGVMVSRPCGDPGLARRLYRLMCLGNCVLYTPGEDGYIVASSQATDHMPDDMKECLGEAQVARDETEFVAMYAL